LQKSIYYLEKAQNLYEKNRILIEFDRTFSLERIELIIKIENYYRNIDFDSLNEHQKEIHLFRRGFINSLLVLVYSSEKKYIKEINIPNALNASKIVISSLLEINLNKSHNIKEKTEILRNTYYNTGNIYSKIKDYKNSILCFEEGLKLNHIPSIYNLAATFNDENNEFYDQQLAGDLYIKAANTEYDGIGNKSVALTTLVISCINAGRTYFERDKAEKGIEMFEKALKTGGNKIPNEIRNYINSKINSVRNPKNNNIKFTSKHDKVVSLLSKKTLNHLSDQHFIFIETSLLVYDFLHESKFQNLDYSSAIMPILKCIENILFPILGKEYLAYLNKLNNVDFSKIPINFWKLDKRINKKVLLKDIVTMDMGKYLYVISDNPYSIEDEISLNASFLNFMKLKGIDNDRFIYIDFIKKLIDVKDRYRNIASHRDIVDEHLANDCLDYLLNTIKFINKTVETFFNA
jgi:tetratricopeptide (TPR) repeat protein